MTGFLAVNVVFVSQEQVGFYTVVSQAEAAYFENTFNLEGTVSDKSDRAFPDVGCLWPHRATQCFFCVCLH